MKELIDRGINHDGIRLILDLEYRNARLIAENRYLHENLHLRSANGHPGARRPSNSPRATR